MGIFDRLAGNLQDEIEGVSGGSSTQPPAAGTPKLDDFQVQEGAIPALAGGLHLIGGTLIEHDYTEGPPPVLKYGVLLGEGDDGGGEGEFDSIVTLWHAGEPLNASPDGSTAGYHFHPGTLSTSLGDATQGQDSFFPTGTTHSGKAWVAVRCTEALSAEDAPQNFRALVKCRKLYSYDVNGARLTKAYTVNGADWCAHLILNRAGLPASRVDWPSLFRLRNDCAETISWDDGASVRNIARFEAHPVFTQDADLGAALSYICAIMGAWWRDDGERISFVSPLETTIKHHFHEGNIVLGSVNVEARELRDRPNVFTATFRDTDSEYLAEASVEVRRENLIRRFGENRVQRVFPPMTYSEAQRLLERQARLEADNAVIATLRGKDDCYEVLPGDWVTITHPKIGTDQRAVVTNRTWLSAETTADEVLFSCQIISTPYLYSDADHGPK